MIPPQAYMFGDWLLSWGWVIVIMLGFTIYGWWSSR